MLDSVTAPTRELLMNHPAGAELQSKLVASVHSLHPEQVCVANGIAELITLLHDVRGPIAMPVPNPDEYEDVLRTGQLVPFELSLPEFGLNVDPVRAAWARDRLPIRNLNGIAEEFLRVLPHFRADFRRSCALVRSDIRALVSGLEALGPLTVVPSKANFVFVGLPGRVSAASVADALFADDHILVEDCGGKAMTDGDRWLRIASRSRDENERLTQALDRVLRRMAD